MSSGDSETPPTYYFSGMTFNPDFYTTSTSTYITKVTGKKYFLSYPTAQGDETINSIYAENISPITSTENIYIGSSQTLGTMEIAMSTTRTGTLKLILHQHRLIQFTLDQQEQQHILMVIL